MAPFSLRRPPLAEPISIHQPPLHLKLFTSLFATMRATFSHIFQHCSKRQDPSTGQMAHARMIISGFSPTLFVTNCLIQMHVKCSNLDYARKVFDRMPHRDSVSWNAMISGYASNGFIGISRGLFDGMPCRDVVSWNSMMSGCLQNGKLSEPIELFSKMRLSDVDPDRTTFAILLKLCSLLEDNEMGMQIHGVIVKMGLDVDVVAGSAVVDMYAKCKNLSSSLYFFCEMPERNWISWSAAIGGCIQNEQFCKGLQLFNEMQREGIGVSQSSYASIFRSCAGLSCARTGGQYHCHSLKNNYDLDIVVGTAILDMYAKSGGLDDAMKVFQYLPTRSLQTWNAVIVGFVRNGQGLEAMELFRAMQRSGVGVDGISLSGVFSACAEAKGYLQGLQAHSLAIKSTLSSDICVANAILDMYGKCRAIDEAYSVFEEMNRRDIVSWNAIIAAFEQNEKYEETLLHFDHMLRCGMDPDDFTYGSVLKACAGLQSRDYGEKIHDKIIKSGLGLDPFIGSALIDMYCKCGMMEEAQKLHSRIEEQTLVSWNAIISGFSLQKQSEVAQNLFSKMIDMGLKPDNFTYATVLDTCANLAMVGLGKQMHAQIIKQKLKDDIFISSSLVDMYAKCGHLPDSLLIFEKMLERDFVSWNALICGYAHHGLGSEAIKMFEQMQLENIKPNQATFISVLRACAHVGLVDEGIHYFDLMTKYYTLEPQIEHYSCMVDIIGRAKGIHEALELINSMPFEPDDVIWRTLLNVCKIHGNVEMAEVAVANILRLDPQDSSSYIHLSNIYAEVGRWGDVSKLRRIMKESRMKKEPGCSWIEVMSDMHTFLVGDKAHRKCREIYEMLDYLIGEMKWTGYEPDIELFCDDGEEESEDQQETGVCNG
ncbi:uncharacterized protein A4U43_C03F31180 [Asparagus officinalis]|uniref:Pentatricopeptide repeat-containing protein n=1 Tax=Asparagus officinalis TaxID=4686 RepID=A0A5P1FH08_ASPOF|nr:pentatricopeptide repeat-containing protein At3g02330 [Asparagus officinalis]ONK76697.1 uncharacterized protein A4U43_C03F31180 [Asparagus officinalis]